MFKNCSIKAVYEETEEIYKKTHLQKSYSFVTSEKAQGVRHKLN